MLTVLILSKLCKMYMLSIFLEKIKKNVMMNKKIWFYDPFIIYCMDLSTKKHLLIM